MIWSINIKRISFINKFQQRIEDRNFVREQREYDAIVINDRLCDTILVTYFNGMSSLLHENNGILTANLVAVMSPGENIN